MRPFEGPLPPTKPTKLVVTSFALAALSLLHCGSNGSDPAGSPPDASATGGTGGAGGSDTPQGYPDVFDPTGAPTVGGPGCGFGAAAFCDTFDGPATVEGRAGEMHPFVWSAARMMGQLTTTRAMGIGMALIPDCRPGVSNHVWPNDDTLVCNATSDIASDHLLVAVAAQHYGQNGYRIRQPFDFAGRTGKVVFDATVDPLGGLHGWVSFAVTEDPIPMPGYSIYGNDEGSIIPKNAVEVHFINAPGSTGDAMSLRNIHFFENYADTVYTQDPVEAAPYQRGKMNHFEFLVSEHGIQASVTPYSEDGLTFGAPAIEYRVDRPLPFSRGYVHVSVHNHATMKYTQPYDGYDAVVNASVAHIDNVGFDGDVITNWREYEIPDALVEFTEAGFQPVVDPYNPDNRGVDIAYVVNDEAEGPKQTLRFEDVDLQDVTSARLVFAVWVDGSREEAPPAGFAFRARLNGNEWLERRLSPEEVAFFTEGPTTVEPDGTPIGDPASQGRLALIMDVPLDDLVSGDNTVEFVTGGVPTSYPPLVCNIDLVMQTE